MTLGSDTMDEAPPPAQASAPVRPFYWSVRRELWESRSLYLAPLIAAGVVLLGFLIGVTRLPAILRAIAGLDPERQGDRLAIPFHIVSVAVVVTSLIVAVFYCLGALYNERRDRNILFWKSLPVSDLITVLSKASLPIIGLPIIAAATVGAVQLIMLLLSTLVLWMNGLDARILWTRAPLLDAYETLLYGLPVLSLWYAPIYGWLLLVSAWAKRAPFLWALLTPLALCLVEQIAFDTHNLASLLGYRLGGVFKIAFTDRAPGEGGGQMHADPVGFLTSPGLWTGLIFAAACLAGAIWLRRRREPI
jgi:ABC-2 type transport system permease protein